MQTTAPNDYYIFVLFYLGTRIIVNMWAVNHDESFWKDPFVFKPERFLDGLGNLLAADSEPRKRVVVFGGGYRRCIGW